MSKAHAVNCFYSSFKEKYIIMDNLDEKNDPIIKERDEVYNSEYIYVTVVLRGTLNITVGNVDLEIKANEYLAVTPCMKVKVKDSRCLFFSFITRSYIMGEIYERTEVKQLQPFHAFYFQHAHYSAHQIEELLTCYLRIKELHMSEDFPMKELALNAYQAAYVSRLYSFAGGLLLNDLPRSSSRQMELFAKFIKALSKGHRQYRSVQYYAHELCITPKYLSSIVLNHTGLTASQVIDQYVVYAIKLALYKNEHNIKAISNDFNFPSQSFFGRYFKRVTGLSPNEYIKGHNIKSINFLSE